MKKERIKAKSTGLKRKADIQLINERDSKTAVPMAKTGKQHLAPELQVQKGELESQNQELMLSRAEVEAGLRQYTDLYDFAPVGYFTLDRDGAIRKANLTGAHLLGVERGKLLRRRFTTFISSPSHSTFDTFLEKTFASREKETCEVILENEVLEPLWVQLEATSPDGQECRAVVVNITIRKQAEEALRQSEALYRSLLENVQVGVGIAESDGKLVSFNDAMLSPGGYTRADLEKISNVANLYYDPQDRQRVLDILAKQGAVSELPIRFKRKDSSPYDTLLWLTPTMYQDRPCIQAVVQDITERKRAEEALRHSEVETTHANRQLLALSQAAQAVQRARTKEEVYQTIQEQMTQLDYKATVFELDDEGKDLRIAFLFYDGKLVRKAEKMTGLSIRDYRIHPRQGSIYQRVLADGETVHVTDAAQAVADTLPKSLRALAGPSKELFHLQACCFAPLTVEGKTIGILAVTGSDLTEADSPAITTFANQAAVAMQNARLHEQARQEITNRKLMEETLKKEDHLLSEAQRIAHIGSWEADLGTGKVNWSEEIYRIYDVTPETFVPSQNSIIDLIHPEDKAIMGRWIESAISGKKLDAVEVRVINRDGNVKFILGDGEIFFDETGKPLQAIGTAQDITERKLAEKEIQKRNEDLAFLNNINTAINRGGSLDSLTLLISKETKRIFSTNGATLHLVDPVRKCLVLKNLSMPPDLITRIEKIIGISIPRIEHDLKANHPYRQIMESGKSKIIHELHDIEEFTAGFLPAVHLSVKTQSRLRRFIPSIVKLMGYRSVLVVPLISGNEVIGTLDMGRRELFTEDDAKRLEIIAGQLTIAIQRKQAEEALRESEERYRLLAVNATDVIWTMDMNLKSTYTSPSVLRLRGYTSEEAMNQPLEKALTPGSYKAVSEMLEKELTLEKIPGNDPFRSQTLELEAIRKDGSTVWVESTMTFLRDPRGKPVEILGVTRDITGRKEADQALRESEEKMRSIFRVAPTGIGVVRDRVLLEVNPRICELTGYSQDELVGKSARVLYPTQEEFEFVGREKYEQIAQKGSGMVETRWQKKDGFIIDILLASTPIDLADLSKGVIFTALDITGRKEADQALREAHDRMLLVLDSIPANIYVADLKTYEILFMNKNMRDSFGNNLVGEVCWHVFRDGSGPCPHCSNSKLIDSQGNPTEGVTWEGQNPFTRLWYTNYDRAIRWVNGELVRLEISVDIAERKRAEEEIRQRAGELAALQATVLDLTTQHDPEDLLQSIVERAANLLKAEGGGLYLCDPEQREARCVVSYNLQRDFTGVLLKYGEGAAGTVAQTGLPLKIDDYRNWSGRASTFDEEQPFRALVSAPMLWQGRVTGVIHVLRSTSENPFTTEDQDLLALFANHAAIAFENAHLFDQVQRRLRESESLSQTSQALTGSLEIQPLLENILEAARHAIPAAEKGTIVLEEAEDTLRIRAMSGYLDGDLLNLAFNPGEGFVARVFEEQQPICLDDVQADYRIPYGGQFEEMKTVRSAIAAPLTVKGERIGVISLDNAVSTSAFTQDDMQLLVSFASSAAVAIHNARLFDQTRRRARLLTALHEISQKTSHLFDLKSIGEMTIPTIENLLGWTRGSLWLADEDANPKMLIHSTTGFKGKARQQELVRLRTLVSHPGEGIIGWVIQNGESLRSGNVLQESRYVMGNPDIRSELCVPLKMGEKTIGCINFESTSENAFSEEDEQVLSTLAGEIAGAIERARLFDQTRRRADELGALAQVSAALRIATTRAEMIPVILNQITEILHIEDAALLTYDPASGENLVELACGKWMQVTGQRISNKENYSSMLAQTGLPFQSDNISKDKRFAAMAVFRDPEAVAGLPLLVQKQYLGSLWVGRRAENDQQLPPPFMDEELRLLGSIADMTANAIHRAHLHEQTVRYADQMITVNEIGHMLSETLDLDQVYSRLTSAIQNLLPDLCGIFISLYEKRTQTIICTSAVVDGAVLDVKEIPRLPFDPEGMSRQSRVLVTSQPLIANDLAVSMVKDPRVEPGGDPMRKPESALYVPMLSKDTPIGLIQVQSYKPDCFGQEDVNLLSLVANTAAITIENARLFAETEKRLRYISALHNIDAAISASVDLRVTLSIILENVTKELSVDAAALALMNPYSKTLEYTASRGFRTRIIEGMRVRLGEGLVGQAAIQRRLVGLTETGQRELDLFGEEKFAAQFAVPLIAKGQVQGVLQVFHRSALELDMDWTNFLNTLAGQAAIAMDNASLFDNLQRSNLELTLAYDATIQGWSQAMELRDKETQGHAERVTGLTMRLASEMELSDAESVHLRRGVLLHDIGKMGIPDAILLKPGPLTPEEWEIMRMHPVYAFEMLSGISYLHQAVDVPYCHHEKWDGSGYPRGLKGEQIPLSGRLFAVVDVFDALTSDRPYRKAWSREQALGYLREQSGKHFDPQVAEVFLNMRL